MCILSQNTAEGLWHSDYYPKSSSQPLLQTGKRLAQTLPSFNKDNHQLGFKPMDLGQAGVE